MIQKVQRYQKNVEDMFFVSCKTRRCNEKSYCISLPLTFIDKQKLTAHSKLYPKPHVMKPLELVEALSTLWSSSMDINTVFTTTKCQVLLQL